ncbi:MAG TPA: Crp/Fnr family transcriptional regulator [Xanthobacteraceae bacterium]|jgi:CRP-like cAMP-binding protein|nr:Crp/Fnr family transcriptional regulator [Xanthobacteraceae bacterium]
MPTKTLAEYKRVRDLLLAKVREHGTLTAADESAICAVRAQTKALAPGADVVCQGDRPDVAVFVLAGMLARYHTLPSGDRQYLSFHIKGDLPDVHGLLLSIMDHSLCALDEAEIAVLPHEQLVHLCARRPGIAFAFWRLTLVDAAIFRQAITNNGIRSHAVRAAHFFCEQYFRAREAGLVEDESCSVPLNQSELGQALGMSHISVNRTMQRLRKDRLADLRSGRLTVLNWNALQRFAAFDPTYLHLDKISKVSQTRFRTGRK